MSVYVGERTQWRDSPARKLKMQPGQEVRSSVSLSEGSAVKRKWSQSDLIFSAVSKPRVQAMMDAGKGSVLLPMKDRSLDKDCIVHSVALLLEATLEPLDRVTIVNIPFHQVPNKIRRNSSYKTSPGAVGNKSQLFWQKKRLQREWIWKAITYRANGYRGPPQNLKPTEICCNTRTDKPQLFANELVSGKKEDREITTKDQKKKKKEQQWLEQKEEETMERRERRRQKQELLLCLKS